MLMSVQMILTVLVITCTFRTVTELQIIPVFFCSAAHCALVMGLSLRLHLNLRLELTVFSLSPLG